MCHGTAKLLQLQGPIDSLSPLDKILFDGFRVLEAIRAIMYGDETFLSQDVWQQHRPGPTSEGVDWSDPMEMVHRLVIQVASFSKRQVQPLAKKYAAHKFTASSTAWKAYRVPSELAIRTLPLSHLKGFKCIKGFATGMLMPLHD